MVDILNLDGTFIRKTTRYFVRSEPTDDGMLVEEVTETSLNNEGAYEVNATKGLSVLDCGHIVHHHNEIGCKCAYCGGLNCLQHTYVCSNCLQTIGNCCVETFEGLIVCVDCRKELRRKQATSLLSRATGKVITGTMDILLSPFK